jgi:hypothetical protein
MLLKINPYFFWHYKILIKYKDNNFALKSGIKYGGNFLAYQKKFKIVPHIHSNSIIYLGNFQLIEKFCKYCSNDSLKEWKNFHNLIILGQQVSKKIIFIDYKKIKKKKKNRWIIFEWKSERWNKF